MRQKHHSMIMPQVCQVSSFGFLLDITGTEVIVWISCIGQDIDISPLSFRETTWASCDQLTSGGPYISLWLDECVHTIQSCCWDYVGPASAEYLINVSDQTSTRRDQFVYRSGILPLIGNSDRQIPHDNILIWSRIQRIFEFSWCLCLDDATTDQVTVRTAVILSLISIEIIMITIILIFWFAGAITFVIK